MTNWGHSARDIPDAIVVIRDGKITEVGLPGAIPIPKGARIIDCTGKFLIPGLVDGYAGLNSQTWRWRWPTASGPRDSWSRKGGCQGRSPAEAMSRDHALLEGPLRLISVTMIDAQDFEARYVFRAPGGHVCNGDFIVAVTS